MDLCPAHPLESWRPFDIVVNSAYALLSTICNYNLTNTRKPSLLVYTALVPIPLLYRSLPLVDKELRNRCLLSSYRSNWIREQRASLPRIRPMEIKVQAEMVKTIIYRRSITNQIVPVFALHMVVKGSMQWKLSSYSSDILKNSCSSDSRISWEISVEQKNETQNSYFSLINWLCC